MHRARNMPGSLLPDWVLRELSHEELWFRNQLMKEEDLLGRLRQKLKARTTIEGKLLTLRIRNCEARIAALKLSLLLSKP